MSSAELTHAGPGNGQYKLIPSYNTVECVETINAATWNGAGADLWPCTQSADPNWNLVKISASVYEIRQAKSGNCLAAQGNNLNNGTPLVLWTCQGQVGTRFTPVQVGSNWTFKSIDNANKCIDVNNWGGNSAAVQIWDCTGGTNQQFQLQLQNDPDNSSRTCPLPSSYSWTSTMSLAEPKSPAGHNFISLKDFTVVRNAGKFVVYASVFDTVPYNWNMVNFNFTDWSQANSASQFYMQNSPTQGGIAPQVFYFSRTSQWVLVYQYGATYSTGTDPSNPTTWSARHNLLTNGPSGVSAIDYSVICDGSNGYLFYGADNGKIYQSVMPKSSFPGTFNGYTTILSDTQFNLYESPRIYSVMGTNQYLLIVEAVGASGRYFRSFTATNLAGPWTLQKGSESDPFAGVVNVSFPDSTNWSNDISHGDIVRYNPNETMPINACNMQFLYQGFDKNAGSPPYGEIPYRPLLATMTQ